MTIRNKAILINSAIVVGLMFEYWTGKPLVALVVAGILLLVIANLGMLLAARKQSARP